MELESIEFSFLSIFTLITFFIFLIISNYSYKIKNGARKSLSMSGGQYNVPIVFRGPTGNAGQLSSQHSQNF